ncbi:MAG TPA: L,D-transpeptidase [Xanthobacteraceae bacterium]|nr:L,D-transpeptidase [Xanthobacteraceae bacterium]
MRKFSLLPLFVLLSVPAAADPFDAPRDPKLVQTPRYIAPPSPDERAAPRAYSDFADNRPGAARPGSLGGGFIEFLFTGRSQELPRTQYQRPWEDMSERQGGGRVLNVRRDDPAVSYEQPRPAMDPRYQKQIVEYPTKEAPGTVVIDTNNRFLYYVQGGGRAIRYGVGVGRPGFEWAGVKSVSEKKEWPDWRPPAEMLARRPELPTYMAGGPDNPLGARAIYLGSSLYRIHGSNEPQTIGTAVSSGCIRMRNEDVIDLYERVKVGTKVIVI